MPRELPEDQAARRCAIAKRLKLAREKAGLRRETVAHHTGLTANRLDLIESGSRPIPVEYLVQLAKLYGTSVGRLLGERRPETDRQAAAV